MSESDIVRSCLDLLRAKRITAFRVNNTGIWDAKRGIFRKSPNTTRGIPDIIGILPIMSPDGTVGAFMGVECKSAKGKISEAQNAISEDIVASGGYYLIAHSSEELENDLKELGF